MGEVVMDEEPSQPAKPDIPPPSIPPPSIPKPTIPPPDIKPPEPVAVPSRPPLVNVKIREAGEEPDDEGKPGGLAPFNTRALAALIDVALAIGLQISVLWILPGFAERIAWLVGGAYLVGRDSLPFLDGQSVGKKAMKLRVLTLEGKPVTGNWEAALIRNAILLIPVFPLIELFVLLTRDGKPDQGRRLGDEWAKTKVVIAEDPSPKPEDAP
jgi:uncharacterized RDD family membrane protein YckC